MRTRADELVARVEPGEAFDVVEQIAVPFPLWIIAELLGIPEADWHRFYLWSEASIPGATDWPPEECQRLQAEMHEYLLETTRARRADPRDDIISVLAHAEVDGESLNDDELVMFLNQLLVAGNETTRHAVSGGIAALAQHPEQWRRLVADRSLLDTATEEILRWTTPVISFMRTATRDTELRGVEIAANDPVLLLYASANRDEDEFGPTAAEFDVGRDPNHEVALGFGPHFCLGAALGAHRDLGDARRAARPILRARAGRRGRAHGVVRDRRHQARARRPVVTVVTPQGSAYRGDAVQLDLPVLAAGEAATISVPDGTEAAVVLLAGDVDLAGQRVRRAPTCSPNARRPCTSRPVPTSTSSRTRAPSSRSPRRSAATFPRPRRFQCPCRSHRTTSSCTTVARRDGSATVHDVIADTVPAQRLLVGETFNAPGEWSSFPPHKHDGGDGEPALEEVYYYRFDRPDGFGFQGLYEWPTARGDERAVFLRHGAVVGIPRGYHPVCAAPGYRLYYLWALAPRAGTAARWRCTRIRRTAGCTTSEGSGSGSAASPSSRRKL